MAGKDNFMSEMRDSIASEKGRGRPTDSTWTKKARVPMSESTHQLLRRLAADAGVGYTQFAARLVERGLALLTHPDRADQSTSPYATEPYARKLLGASQFGFRQSALNSAVAGFTDEDWTSLLMDCGYNIETPDRLRFFVPESGSTAESFAQTIVQTAAKEKGFPQRLSILVQELIRKTERFLFLLRSLSGVLARSNGRAQVPVASPVNVDPPRRPPLADTEALGDYQRLNLGTMPVNLGAGI